MGIRRAAPAGRLATTRVRLSSADRRLLAESLELAALSVADQLLAVHRRSPEAVVCQRFRDWLTHAETLQARLGGVA